jgi:hypothetical protein
MGQGQSAAPEGWSFANELIDPDAVVVEKPAENDTQVVQDEKAVADQVSSQ